MKPFASRLHESMRAKKSAVCVGLDPRLELLPAPWRHAARGDGIAQAQAFEEFCVGVLDAVKDVAVAVKPQAAFFERLRSAGAASLERVIAAAHARGLLVIADVKRGDIGTTAEAYAEAWLGGDEFAPLADACTVNAYLGGDGVKPFVKAATQHGGGLFVLVKTSNPGSAELQDLVSGEHAISSHVARLVRSWNERDASGYGPVGAVVGATWPAHLIKLREELPGSVLLLPGYGAQGAGAADVVGGFDSEGLGAVVTASRSVTFPWGTKAAPADWRGMISEAAEQMRVDLDTALQRRG